MKNYQLIEHDYFLTELVIEKIPDEVTITIMLWFVHLLQNDEYIKTKPVEISVIPVSYTGKYPCIGIHYLEEPINDLSSEVLNRIETYSLNMNFSSYYDYIKTNSILINRNIEIYNNM